MLIRHHSLHCNIEIFWQKFDPGIILGSALRKTPLLIRFTERSSCIQLYKDAYLNELGDQGVLCKTEETKRLKRLKPRVFVCVWAEWRYEVNATKQEKEENHWKCDVLKTRRQTSPLNRVKSLPDAHFPSRYNELPSLLTISAARKVSFWKQTCMNNLTR